MTPPDNKALAEAVEAMHDAANLLDVRHPRQKSPMAAVLREKAEALTREPSTPSAQVPGGGDELECIAQAAAALDVLGRKPLAAWLMRTHAKLSAPQARPDGGEAVGEAGAMPGTSGFTTAVFKASDVPVGTKLYTHPTPAPDVARLVEAVREILIDVKRAQANMRLAAAADPRWEGCAEAIEPRVQALREALAPFTAAQPDQEAADGQE